jgi:hypothetical protein
MPSASARGALDAARGHRRSRRLQESLPASSGAADSAMTERQESSTARRRAAQDGVRVAGTPPQSLACWRPAGGAAEQSAPAARLI